LLIDEGKRLRRIITKITIKTRIKGVGVAGEEEKKKKRREMSMRARSWM